MSELFIFLCIICTVPPIVYGLCSDNSQMYYQMKYHTTDSSTLPSTRHLNVHRLHCISSCEGFVKHDPITQVCECYSLPYALTNVAVSSSEIWMPGMYLIYNLVLCSILLLYIYVIKKIYYSTALVIYSFCLLQIQRYYLYVNHHR